MKWTIAILLTLSVAFSQERPKEPKRDKRRYSGMMEDMKRRHAQVLEKLKKDDPKEHERITKLKETDRRQYYREIMKLMKPSGDRGEAGDRQGQKHEGRHRGHKLGGEGSREQFIMRFKTHMEKLDPKRAKEIQELLRTNPEKGRDALRKIMSSFKEKHFARKGDERVDKLLKEYKSADDARKTEIKKELRKLVEESFDKRMRMKQAELEHMKKRISSAEDALKKYEASRAPLCDKRLEYLLQRAEEGRTKGQPDRRPERANRPDKTERRK